MVYINVNLLPVLIPERKDIMICKFTLAVITFLLCLMAFIAQAEEYLFLSDIEPTDTLFQVGGLGKDVMVSRDETHPIIIKSYSYDKGLSVHAYCKLAYDIGGEYELFTADIGVSGYAPGRMGSVDFSVYGDGKLLYQSGNKTLWSGPEKIRVNVEGVKKLELAVDSAGDGILGDHAIWGDAALLKSKETAPPATRKKFTVDQLRQWMLPQVYEFRKYPVELATRGYWIENIGPLEPQITDGYRPALKHELTSFGAPGQTILFSFVIKSAADIENIKLTASALEPDDPDIASDDLIEPGNIKTAMIIPSRMQPALYTDTIEKIAAGSNARILIMVELPDKLPSGTYTGRFTIAPGDKQSTKLTLSVDVLPITLLPPENKRCGIYYYMNADRTIRRDVAEKEMADAVAHGVGTVVWQAAPLIKTGNGWTLDMSEIETYWRLMQQFGFEGPLVINPGFRGIARRMGYDEEGKHRETGKLLSQDREFAARVKEINTKLLDLKSRLGIDEISLYIRDEPFIRGRLPFYLMLVEASKQTPGFTYWCTMYHKPDMMKQADPYIDVRCYHGDMHGESFAKLEQELQEAGDRAWYYYNVGGDNVLLARVANGVYFWKSPFEVHVPQVMPRHYYPFFRTPGPESGVDPLIIELQSIEDAQAILQQGPNTTLFWEAYREGYYDLIYLNTLKQEIERVGDGAEVERGIQLLKKVTGLNESAKKLSQLYTNKYFNDLRREIADLIVQLQRR
jgi:NPCBM/NEW2 domain